MDFISGQRRCRVVVTEGDPSPFFFELFAQGLDAADAGRVYLERAKRAATSVVLEVASSLSSKDAAISDASSAALLLAVGGEAAGPTASLWESLTMQSLCEAEAERQFRLFQLLGSVFSGTYALHGSIPSVQARVSYFSLSPALVVHLFGRPLVSRLRGALGEVSDRWVSMLEEVCDVRALKEEEEYEGGATDPLSQPAPLLLPFFVRFGLPQDLQAIPSESSTGLASYERRLKREFDLLVAVAEIVSEWEEEEDEERKKGGGRAGGEMGEGGDGVGSGEGGEESGSRVGGGWEGEGGIGDEEEGGGGLLGRVCRHFLAPRASAWSLLCLIASSLWGLDCPLGMRGSCGSIGQAVSTTSFLAPVMSSALFRTSSGGGGGSGGMGEEEDGTIKPTGCPSHLLACASALLCCLIPWEDEEEVETGIVEIGKELGLGEEEEEGGRRRRKERQAELLGKEDVVELLCDVRVAVPTVASKVRAVRLAASTRRIAQSLRRKLREVDGGEVVEGGRRGLEQRAVQTIAQVCKHIATAHEGYILNTIMDTLIRPTRKLVTHPTPTTPEFLTAIQDATTSLSPLTSDEKEQKLLHAIQKSISSCCTILLSVKPRE